MVFWGCKRAQPPAEPAACAPTRGLMATASPRPFPGAARCGMSVYGAAWLLALQLGVQGTLEPHCTDNKTPI